MAKILRYGKTPLWGVYNQDIVGSSGNSAIILDSYNYSVEVKDYEQLDEAGRVKGYLIYDQTVNYDMSGTILYPQNSENGIETAPHESNPLENQGINCNNGVGAEFAGLFIHTKLGGVNNTISNPTTAIVKSYSVNTSQGSAVTFSTSGSIYDFGQASC